MDPRQTCITAIIYCVVSAPLRSNIFSHAAIEAYTSYKGSIGRNDILYAAMKTCIKDESYATRSFESVIANNSHAQACNCNTLFIFVC